MSEVIYPNIFCKRLIGSREIEVATVALRRMAILACSTFQNARDDLCHLPRLVYLSKLAIKFLRTIDRDDWIAMLRWYWKVMHKGIVSRWKNSRHYLSWWIAQIHRQKSQTSKHLRDKSQQAFSCQANSLKLVPGLEKYSCLLWRSSKMPGRTCGPC